MAQKSFIKCPQCNTKNQNTDYCVKCGALINVVLERKIESEEKIQERVEKDKSKGPDKMDRLLQKGENHPNSFIRYFARHFQSVWTLSAMVVGVIIAVMIAIAAG
jgi:uncharacterized Zn finger protein (UPF0148 family)